MKQPGLDTHNTARFFVEHPHVSWVLLLGTVVWGIYGYVNMPQRKDPDIPLKVAMVETPWPGASAQKVEELVTKNIEKVIASNTKVSKIDSTSRTHDSIVVFSLADEISTAEVRQVLDDIAGRLDSVRNLPEGAGPINYQRDFGDTATLMLTVASPKSSGPEIDLRAARIREGIQAVRPAGDRATIVLCFPPRENYRLTTLGAVQFIEHLRSLDASLDPRLVQAASCVGADLRTTKSDAGIQALLADFIRTHYPEQKWEPDVWPPFVVRDLKDTRDRLAAVAGEKYSYRELDEFTDVMEKAILATGRKDVGAPLVSKVTRAGVLPERVYLTYSQERLASYGVKTGLLTNILRGRNLTTGAGEFDTGGKSVLVTPSGEFRSEKEIGNVTVGATPYGTPLYLRDVADIIRSYESPAHYLNFYSWPEQHGHWQRSRAVTLAVQMGAGQQIGEFARKVDATLAELRRRLPPDLVIERTSDQPRQVEENVELFMTSLYEAVGLVVLISFIGFWEWRSALLIALSIPLTLLMTFGMMHLIGMDLQQVSIATLIIALGLLVDDPVVAGDAIKRELGEGTPRGIAAWLGPTKLATAILYATITNIVAYLPFLILKGTMGEFIYALPVVMTCSLVASRVVSMTFIPFLGAYILRGHRVPSIEERRSRGFAAFYYRSGQWAIRHRWLVMAGALGILAAGSLVGSSLKQQFMPKDLAQLAFIDVLLPEDAALSSTSAIVAQVERIVQQVSAERNMPVDGISSFVGGSAPRFWYSLAPDAPHANYAQIVMLFHNKQQTHELLPYIQARASREISGAHIDVRQLENGDSVGLPVAIRISGEDIGALRAAAEQVSKVLRANPLALRVRDNWGEDRFHVEVIVDPDRANLAGLSNADVAISAATAINGYPVSVLREGDKQIPIVARLRTGEMVGLNDINNLYVYSSSGTQKVPLRQIAHLDYSFRGEVIRRRNQFRTITVSAVPIDGVLSSEVMALARPELERIERGLPPGYKLEIGGEEEKQKKGFEDLTVVLITSVLAIFIALTFQFKNAVKPFIVFAAVPFGATGALTGLLVMGAPFGFMGFLGVISLVGVIVSHIIVLFDFIEEKHKEGAPFVEAVLDAGIMRLRPVLITVGATVFGLFPLAVHGGPLWEPLCYAQIGGLTAATFITLLLVPVFYAICVLDLKLVRWAPKP